MTRKGLVSSWPHGHPPPRRTSIFRFFSAVRMRLRQSRSIPGEQTSAGPAQFPENLGKPGWTGAAPKPRRSYSQTDAPIAPEANIDVAWPIYALWQRIVDEDALPEAMLD